MQPLRQSILDMEAIMSVADIYEKRATFSFEVFPPKTDVGMEKLCGKDGVLDKLYTLQPDYISCTYGAGGTNVGKNLEVLDKIQKDGKTIPVTHFTCIGNTKEDIKEKLQTYLDHGIDLSREKIAVSICAQHNNGGVAGNEWWESEINRLFPIGEVNGSHGVYRPGGTALNAGQVGGLRAAQYIVHHDAPSVPEREAFLCEQAEAIGEIQRLIEETGCQQPIDVKQETEALRRRMTQDGAFIRSQEGVETALRENRAQQSRLSRAHGLTDKRRLPDFFRLRELLIAQFVYLSAIDDYIRQIGVSRNSYLVYNKNGTLPHEGVAECFRNVTKQTDTARLQEIVYDRKTESCRVTWRPVRGLPDSDQWFETAWKKYREGDTFHRR